MQWVVKSLNSNWLVGCGMAIFQKVVTHDSSLNLKGRSPSLVTEDTVDLVLLVVFSLYFSGTFTQRQEKLKEQFFSSHL